MFWLALFACNAPIPEVDPSDTPIDPYDPLPLVDPFIGTGGQGFEVGSVNPGPLRPFGMVRVGPDTRADSTPVEYLHCAGYHYDDTRIEAFSHNHAHGIGIGDYGQIAWMPRASWDAAYTTDAGRAVGFDHAREQASPGYYSVELNDGVRVEITATERAALHRWTFPDGGSPVAVLDLAHFLGEGAVVAAEARLDGDRVEGIQHSSGSYSGRFGGVRTYFSAVFEPAPVRSGTWTDPAQPTPDTAAVSGTSAGLWVEFPEGTSEVTMRLALSYVDAAGAAENLAAELPDGSDFDTVRAASEAAWRDELSNVRVRGGTERERRIFHTALYHAYQMPTRFDDVDGRYRGLDDAIHTTDHPYYTDFSLWDTFRTLHPWLILARPERQLDMVRSLVRHARDGGSFDRWPMAHGYTGGMVGTPTDQVLAETWLKGLREFDAAFAFDRSFAHATGPVAPVGRRAIDAYRARGYVAWEDASAPAALTLEYAWSDHALAGWAEALGRADEATTLRAQSGNWANTWNAALGFFTGRHADGRFDDLDPEAWAEDFVEGGAWQYLWMVPYDVDGMIDVQHAGDTTAWFDRYAAFWNATYRAEDTAFPDPYYWHGNEPDLHYAYLGALAGNANTGVEAQRWIRANRYDDAPVGLDGNDDSGTLSAWYLFSAIGVFPIAGTTTYAVGMPVFDRTEIDQPDGSTLVVEAPVVGADRLAPVGGSDADGPYRFEHADWLDAGVIRLDTE